MGPHAMHDPVSVALSDHLSTVNLAVSAPHTEVTFDIVFIAGFDF
jgi:hypothetical protein